MTLAVVASCTKTEISYDQPDQISFAPVAKVSTKAAVEGTYPVASLPLVVFANAIDGQTEYDYFDNFDFTYDQTSQVLVNANAYWPNEKRLVFAGVSHSGNVASIEDSKITMNFSTNQLTVEGYVQPMATGEATDANLVNDLMWFPRTADQGKTDAGVYQNVAPVMQHACALLKFNFIAEAGLSTVKIKSITVNGLYNSGTVVCGADAAAWTVTESNPLNVPVYTRDDETNATTDEQKAKYTVKVKNTDSTNDVYITPETVTNNTIVIPQTPTTLSVVYDFTTPAGQVLRETVSVPLSLGKETVNEVQTEKKWQSGKRYTYNITMGADQIKIAPTVKDWDPETVPAHN